MIKPNQVERRKQPRVRLQTPTQITSQESGLTCYLKDISVAGAAVILGQPLEELENLGLRAKIEMPELPVVELDCQALVIRCDRNDDGLYEVGLFFHQLSDRESAALADFIAASSEFSPAHS